MIEMIETQDGGDYNVADSGITLDNSIKTMIYLALFGGNLNESTTTEKKPGGVLYDDFWGNVFDKQDTDNLFNSEFERVLNQIPITSGNLIKYKSAIDIDLKFMQNLSYIESVETSVSIVSKARLRFDVVVNQPTKNEPETFAFIWYETLQRVQILQAGN